MIAVTVNESHPAPRHFWLTVAEDFKRKFLSGGQRLIGLLCEIYRDKYIAWFNTHKPEKAKDLDDAMFAFGQFLNYKKNRLLFGGD